MGPVGISYNGPRVGGVSCMLGLVCLQFNNTKPKVSFTVKSASYSRLRSRSKIPLRVFCVSLRTLRRGGQFEH